MKKKKRSGKLHTEETAPLINYVTNNSPLQVWHLKRSWTCQVRFSRKHPQNQVKRPFKSLEKKKNEKQKKLELLIEGDTIRKSLSDSKSLKAIAEMF